MDIIEANECLCHWYGLPRKGTFDNIDVGVTEGEPIQIVSPKEALKGSSCRVQGSYRGNRKGSSKCSSRGTSGGARWAG